LLKAQVNYLDFIIKDEIVFVCLLMKKLMQLNISLPIGRRMVQNFLDLIDYFRKFISRYASIALLLMDLLKDKIKFCFGDKEKHMFNQLKEALSERTIL